MRHLREEEARGFARMVMMIATTVLQQQVELQPGLFAMAMNIISRMAMGKKVGEVSSTSCIVRSGEADRGDALPVGRLLCGQFCAVALVARPLSLLEAHEGRWPRS
ncbi:hypothetical protein L7F22_063216 [Adiantum nelumboides]|nr:hypothetical protein [Adiantum nelumboides]